VALLHAGTEKLLCEEQAVSREISELFYQSFNAEEIDRFEQYLQGYLFNLENHGFPFRGIASLQIRK